MDEIKKDASLYAGKGETDEVEWITVKGTHIPIQEGETPKEALNKKFNTNKKKHIKLPPDEYAGLCSAIRTKYANMIPNNDCMLYKNDLYVYNYNKKSEKILCTFKVKIEGNEEMINKIVRWYDETDK